MRTLRTYENRRQQRHTALMMGEAGLFYLAILGVAAFALFGMNHAIAEALRGLLAVFTG